MHILSLERCTVPATNEDRQTTNAQRDRLLAQTKTTNEREGENALNHGLGKNNIFCWLDAQLHDGYNIT